MLFWIFTLSCQLLCVITIVCWRTACRIPTTNTLSPDTMSPPSVLHQLCIQPCHQMVRMELAMQKTFTLEMPLKNHMDDLNLPTRTHLSRANLATLQILARAINIHNKGVIATIRMPSNNRLRPRLRHMLPSSLAMHPTAYLNTNPFQR